MRYLTELDYAVSIEDDQLDIISGASDKQLKKAEMAAISEMTSYLSGRYDVSKIFIPVDNWNAGTTYNVDQQAYDPTTEEVYISIQAGTNHAVTDAAYWKVGDNRDQFIVTNLTDIALYHLFKKINPRNIPEARGVAYDAAREWLRDIASTKANPLLPLLVEADIKPQIRYGSNEQRKNHY